MLQPVLPARLVPHLREHVGDVRYPLHDQEAVAGAADARHQLPQLRGPDPGVRPPALRLDLDGEGPVDLHAPTLARATDNAARGQGGRERAARAQTWPAFSSAVQQVSTSRRVTTYGSTLALGRRSSM